MCAPQSLGKRVENSEKIFNSLSLSLSCDAFNGHVNVAGGGKKSTQLLVRLD